MEIVNIKIDKLKPYENNPRKNDETVKYLVNAIKNFGFRVPLVIDKNNVIVCGHTRLKALIELGYKDAPCVVLNDLTEDQINAFRLIDNKVAEYASWDYDVLRSELKNIKSINLEELGFLTDDVECDFFTESSELNDKKEIFYECPCCHKEFKLGDLIEC